ncbi:MAG: AAA family ATPase [Patescibacteria group bacterium]
MLNTKYRPTVLADFFGNTSLKESLSQVLSRKKEIPQSFLFTGKSGSGKSTLARIIANELRIDEINRHVYNAANTRGIDTIREIIDSTKYSPLHGTNNKRIYILEESHQLTGASLEGLLHFLEEPPKDVYIVLTTTEPDKLKVTIKRRCFHGEVTPLIRSEMNNLFKTILKKEKKEVDKEVLDKIIKESDGSPGMALKYLDMILDMDKDQGIEIITKATKSESSVIDLCRTLLDPKLNSKSRWKNCQEILKTIEGEPESIRRGVLGYMTKVMLSDSNASVAANTASNFTENYYDSGKAGLVLSVYLCCTE